MCLQLHPVGSPSYLSLMLPYAVALLCKPACCRLLSLAPLQRAGMSNSLRTASRLPELSPLAHVHSKARPHSVEQVAVQHVCWGSVYGRTHWQNIRSELVRCGCSAKIQPTAALTLKVPCCCGFRCKSSLLDISLAGVAASHVHLDGGQDQQARAQKGRLITRKTTARCARLSRVMPFYVCPACCRHEVACLGLFQASRLAL